LNNTADQVGICDDTDLAVPPDCNVRFYNDDYTTKDFVVEVLLSIFHKSLDEAVTLMETVHKTGSAVVGTYTYDIAVTRARATIIRARDEGFPLNVEVERQ
jgi:ATP-dependent Clp protease adaptor protein ClpS